MLIFFFLANQLISEADEFYVDHESAEISPKTGLVVKEISKRIVEFGGAALFAGNFQSEPKDCFAFGALLLNRTCFDSFKF
jgi:hypothetical protein